MLLSTRPVPVSYHLKNNFNKKKITLTLKINFCDKLIWMFGQRGAFPFRWVKFASHIKLFFLLRSKSMAVQISVCKMWYFQWNRWRFEEAILKVVNSSENQLLSFILKFDLSGIMKARNIHSKYWLHVPMHAVSAQVFLRWRKSLCKLRIPTLCVRD